MLQQIPLPVKTLCATVFLLFVLAAKSLAQTDTLSDPDKAFALAKELAFSGKRQEGRELALRILSRYPLYTDIRTFVGRTWAWDGNYEEARKAFARVAATDAKTLDNYIAWIDMERWADDPAKALAVAEKGLTYFNDDPDLLYRKAKLLSLTGRLAEAKVLTQQLLHRFPRHKDASVLLQELRSQLLENALSMGFSYENYSRYYSPARYAFVQGSRVMSRGSVVARLNYADRFGKNAVQPEVDLYPKIYRGIYAYLNAGFSNGSLFPKQRYGAEIFASLPHSFEASAGMRYLYFGADSKVTMYTGSVGFYTGNYWLSLRPYFTPDSGRTSVSASLTARRYFKNPEHYFSLRIGAGFSPELISLQSAAKEFYNLQSQSVSIGYQQPLSKRWTVNGNLSLGRQETLFALGDYSNNLNTSLTVKYRYK